MTTQCNTSTRIRVEYSVFLDLLKYLPHCHFLPNNLPCTSKAYLSALATIITIAPVSYYLIIIRFPDWLSRANFYTFFTLNALISKVE